MGISFVATFYFMLTYTGPFRWVAEWDRRWSGFYSDRIPFLVVSASTFGLLAWVSAPLKRIFPPSRAVTLLIAKVTSRHAIVAFVGVGFAFFGARDYLRAANAGPLTNLDVRHLEAGQPPRSHWVRARGFADTDGAEVFRQRRASTERYIPVISRANDPHQTGIRLFIKAGPADTTPANADLPADYQGFLTPADLPGPVRVSFEQRSLLKGNQYFVLEPGHTPAYKMGLARLHLLIGAGLTLVAAVMALATRIRTRGTASKTL